MTATTTQKYVIFPVLRTLEKVGRWKSTMDYNVIGWKKIREKQAQMRSRRSDNKLKKVINNVAK